MNSVNYSHVGGFDILKNKNQPVGQVDLLIDTGAFLTMMSKIQTVLPPLLWVMVL